MNNFRHFYYNHPDLKNRRRQLRRDSTNSEILLWYQLRNSNLGIKVKRQYSISGFVIDFFCPEIRLAIELEGKIHEKKDQIKYDQYRMSFLRELDIEILRIPNRLVDNNIDTVINLIKDKVSSSHRVGEEVRR